MRLSLRDALVLALRKNLDLRVARIAPEVLEDDVQQALATLDPVLTSSLTTGKSRSQPASSLEGATVGKSDVFAGALAYQRRLTTGSLVRTAVEGSQTGTNSQFSDFGSVNTGSAGISFTQPLLKGRGRRVNLAPIRLARNRLTCVGFRIADPDSRPCQRPRACRPGASRPLRGCPAVRSLRWHRQN